MKRVNIHWFYPFWGSISICIISIVFFIVFDFYVLPIKFFKLGTETYEVVFVIQFFLSLLFIYGLSVRDTYLKRQKLFKFIKKNQLYITKSNKNGEETVIETIEMEWMEKKNEDTFTVRVYNEGGLLSSRIEDLAPKLQAFLGKELVTQHNQITFTDYVFEKYPDKRLVMSNLVDNNTNNKYSIKLTQKISYDIRKVSHGLTVGATGSGKTMFINAKILEFVHLGAEILICDPKNADLSLLQFVKGFPKENVAVNSNQICKILRLLNSKMLERYNKYFSEPSAFGKNYSDFGIQPIVLFFDEVTAFVKVSDKKIVEEAFSYLFNIIMMGRQVGVTIEFILQRPDTSILDGGIRDQLGCRVALGNLSKDGYKMIFGSNFNDYKNIQVIGGGYVQIFGQMEKPKYFETPFFDKNFDFLKELEEYYS